MKKVSVPTYFVLFLLCGVTLWYFGHHRPAQRILKAEPMRVYGTKSPVMPNVVQSDQESVADAPKQETHEVKKNAKVKNLSNPLPLKPTPEKVGTEQEETPSPEEVKAFEAFLTAETEYIEKQELFKKALISGDTDTLEAANASLRNARLRRNETLQNLAVYYEEAGKILEEVIARGRMADEVMHEIDQGNTEFNPKLLETLEEYPFLRDLLKKHGFLSME